MTETSISNITNTEVKMESKFSKIKINNEYHEATTYVKVNGTWTPVTSIYVKASGTWKKIKELLPTYYCFGVTGGEIYSNNNLYSDSWWHSSYLYDRHIGFYESNAYDYDHADGGPAGYDYCKTLEDCLTFHTGDKFYAYFEQPATMGYGDKGASVMFPNSKSYKLLEANKINSGTYKIQFTGSVFKVIDD